MTKMTREYAEQVLLAVARNIVETVRKCGPVGASATYLFLPLEQHGCTAAYFQKIMDGLVAAGKVRRRGDCYVATKDTTPVIKMRAKLEDE